MKPIKVLHLIDSLAPGGAERMAVNTANLLNRMSIETWLCTTRSEGPLKAELKHLNQYAFLEKKHTLDVRSFVRLVNLIRKEEFDVLHAHSTSLAWAVLAKICTGVHVVWHDHYGDSEYLHKRRIFILRQLCRFANHVISVNEQLAAWAIATLQIPERHVTYLPNFAALSLPDTPKARGHDAPIIVCTANLRAAKDHYTLIAALSLLHQEGIPFKTWLVGTEYGDAYSKRLRDAIQSAGLGGQIQILGTQTDIGRLLLQADIGVLSSVTEGLPVALLEYGLAGLPVVVTAVGQCAEVVSNTGMVVPPADPSALASALKVLLTKELLRREYGVRFKQRVQERYSEAAVGSRLAALYAAL